MPVPETKVEANDPTLLESISAGLHGVLALLEIASDRSEDCHAACCLLPAACCLLPAACCLLPAACCLLPAACWQC